MQETPAQRQDALSVVTGKKQLTSETSFRGITPYIGDDSFSLVNWLQKLWADVMDLCSRDRKWWRTWYGYQAGFHYHFHRLATVISPLEQIVGLLRQATEARPYGERWHSYGNGCLQGLRLRGWSRDCWLLHLSSQDSQRWRFWCLHRGHA